MPLQRVHHEVPKSLDGERLDRVLEVLLGDTSRSQAQKLVRRGLVRLNGKRVVRSNGRVARGAEIVVELDVPPVPIEVLFEDRDILVVVKPAGLLTHAADRSIGDDLAARMRSSHGPLSVARGVERAGIVHRLDRDTSGVMVLARDDAALEALQDQFRARTVDKRYLAIVNGVPSQVSFSVDEPLGPVPGTLDRQCVDPEGGKEARTDVEVRESFARHALVECRLHTGRRHQIRVHLAHCGHPVLGDPLYGTKSRTPLPPGAPEPRALCLHASGLAFEHPRTRERVSFEAPPPGPFAKALESVRER